MAAECGPGWTVEAADEFASFMAPLSNWRRWGDDDQLGTVNLLTPEQVRRGIAAVVTGRTVTLGRPICATAEAQPPPLLRLMRASGDGAAAVGASHASEWLGLTFHGFAVTHMDAHAHQFFGAQLYNGRPAARVSTRSGARAGSVEAHASRGLVGRGVLLDAPRAVGRAWLEPGEGLGPRELDLIAAEQSCAVEPGDMVLIRTGRDVRDAAQGPSQPLKDGSPGLEARALSWLRERDVAVLGTDVQADVMQPQGAPHPMPVHAGALVFLGLPLLDNLQLEVLAAACAERGRWDFLLMTAPLELERCTGSPVNPIAVL